MPAQNLIYNMQHLSQVSGMDLYPFPSTYGHRDGCWISEGGGYSAILNIEVYHPSGVSLLKQATNRGICPTIGIHPPHVPHVHNCGETSRTGCIFHPFRINGIQMMTPCAMWLPSQLIKWNDDWSTFKCHWNHTMQSSQVANSINYCCTIDPPKRDLGMESARVCDTILHYFGVGSIEMPKSSCSTSFHTLFHPRVEFCSQPEL